MKHIKNLKNVKAKFWIIQLKKNNLKFQNSASQIKINNPKLK